MTCDDCLGVFASGITGVELQIEVDTLFPNFVCEECSVSEHSPGKVESGETVVFLTIHPIHYDDKTGILSPVAFQQLTKNDLSLLRLAHATSEEFEIVLSTLLAGGSSKITRSVEQCCVVGVSSLRGVEDAAGRVFGVYDTALEKQPAHASVFVRKDYLEKAKRLEARQLALSVFEPHLVALESVKPNSQAS